MAIEIIPKKVEVRKPVNLFDVLFYLSLILLIISILSPAGLFFLEKNFKKRAEDIKIKVEAKGTAEEKKLEEETLLIKKKIDDFAKLAGSHYLNSKFFKTLEELIHPKVFFSKIDLQINKGAVSLSGIAENFEVLGQQILLFEEKKESIKNVNLSNVSIAKDGKVEFTLEISFAAEQFKF